MVLQTLSAASENAAGLLHNILQHGDHMIRAVTLLHRVIKSANLSRKRLSSHVLGKQVVEKVTSFHDAYKPILDDPSIIVVSTDEMYASEKVIPNQFCNGTECRGVGRTFIDRVDISYSVIPVGNV